MLDNSPYKWLHEMLEVFNHGDLHAYDALCTKYASVLNAQPALVEHERRLREKVSLLCWVLGCLVMQLALPCLLRIVSFCPEQFTNMVCQQRRHAAVCPVCCSC